MAGRIGDARTETAAHIGKLRARFPAFSRIAEIALEKLRIIESKLKNGWARGGNFGD
jgi:hypothetical protein